MTSGIVLTGHEVNDKLAFEAVSLDEEASVFVAIDLVRTLKWRRTRSSCAGGRRLRGRYGVARLDSAGYSSPSRLEQAAH